MDDYGRFLATRRQLPDGGGFDPLWMPDFLFDFQRSLVEWSILRGRSAIFADCGLGKTPMQLVWAKNVVRKTNRPVLILTPLAVAGQTVREAEKFGVDAVRIASGRATSPRVYVTNYERLHHFTPDDFAGVVCDESSILKNFDGKRKGAVTEFLRTIPYRLLCTATAAPNDYDELGTSSEALGELGYQDMVTKYFHKKNEEYKHVGWSRVRPRLRAYAETAFWRWVCSWARAVRRPSDLGFDDGPFILPPLECEEHEVKAARPRPGCLFEVTAVTLEEQREEQRRTLPERCGKVADLVNGTGKPALCWTHLNDEGKELRKLISDAVEVSGADDDDAKEEKLLAFAAGQIRILVTKPKMAGFGLNFQHCAHQTYFPSHSFEQWYQGVRRCWRVGQKNAVKVDVVTTEGGGGVLANLNRKAAAADRMFARVVELMNHSIRSVQTDRFTTTAERPQWL